VHDSEKFSPSALERNSTFLIRRLLETGFPARILWRRRTAREDLRASMAGTAGCIIISRVYARKAAAERIQRDRIMTSEMIQLLDSAVNKLAPASP
jgi:hypothetical protein